MPLQADLDQAWLDFSGWRVNYDTVLITLAGFFMAPYAPWSSDRSIRFRIRSRKITTLGDAFRRFRQFVRPVTGGPGAGRGLTIVWHHGGHE